jgi:hypothetical protein
MYLIKYVVNGKVHSTHSSLTGQPPPPRPGARPPMAAGPDVPWNWRHASGRHNRTLPPRDLWTWWRRGQSTHHGSRRIEGRQYAIVIAAMRDALTKRGIRFLVASPPNAATIYQDDLPPWARSNGRETEYTALFADLAARGIKTVDLRAPVWSARSKSPTFFLFDTHWTPRGEIAGFNAIADADGHSDWRIDAAAALAPWTRRQGGDLARMIGIGDDVADPAQELAPHSGQGSILLRAVSFIRHNGRRDRQNDHDYRRLVYLERFDFPAHADRTRRPRRLAASQAVRL